MAGVVRDLVEQIEGGPDPTLPCPQAFAFLAGGESERFIHRHLGAHLPPRHLVSIDEGDG